LESAIASIDVQRVGGAKEKQPTGPSGITEIVETTQPGNYRVESNGNLVDLFAINLFDRSESDIAITETVELGYEEVQATSGGGEQRKEYWRWALIAMLGLLATEWWVYARRVA